MKMPFLCLYLTAGLLVSAIAGGSPLDDQIDAFRKAVKKEVAARQRAAGSGAGEAVAGGVPYFYLGSLGNWQDDANAESMITQIMAASSSDEVQQTGSTLLATIRAQRKAREDAYISSVDVIVKRLPDLLTNAKRSSDLDEVLAQLQKVQNVPRENLGDRAQQASEQARSAYDFVSNWQDYLSNLAAGRRGDAGNNLRNMANNGFGITIIPRSSLLQRAQDLDTPDGSKTSQVSPQETVSSILANVKNMDQVRDAVQRLRELPPGEASNAIGQLLNLLDACGNMNAGLPATFNIDGLNNLNADLRSNVLMVILPRYFDSSTIKELPGELPPVYVSRVAADAVAHGDWQLLRKALSVQNYLDSGRPFGSQNVNVAGCLDSMLQGFNQEDAQQYTMAVISYEAALKTSTTNIIPSKLIGERLAAIRRDHPKDYDAGMQQVLSPPPVPRYYPVPIPAGQYPQGYPPGYQPGYPYPRQAPQTNIAIPAATVPPAPVASGTPAPSATANSKAAASPGN